ncbi:MAG: hypothetical protein GOVbin703_194 [Prokaryotic dsDNA virus sp.]|nr:MAG: hypothetical protein GOVbin703_194 [Prokaryotic dsDNA virus sp.]|tara:strand:- start:276 stop:602 length:327 start_codon:yes stop_codon:yes gene_type:complete
MFTKETKNTLVECADGFTMSVQASSGNYCEPRENDADRYESVEIGYPSAEEKLLIPYAEEPETPTDTVYGWVPADIVRHIIDKHGGIVSGEVPRGIPVYGITHCKPRC